MGMAADQCVLLFASIHFVLKAEQLFKAAGIAHEVVPVPRQLSSDCGMAITISCRELGSVLQVLAGVISIVRLYRQEPGGGYSELPITTDEA